MVWKVDKPFGVEVVGRGPATPALIGLGRICAQEALNDINFRGGKGITKRRKALDDKNWAEAIVIQNGPVPYIKIKVYSQGGAEEKKLIIAIPFEVYVAGSASQNGNTAVVGTTHVYIAEFEEKGSFIRLVDLGELSGILPSYEEKYKVCGPYYVVGSNPKNPITAGTFSFGGYASARVHGIRNRYSGNFIGNLYLEGKPIESLPGGVSGVVQVAGGLVLILSVSGGVLTWAKKVEGEWATFNISHGLNAFVWTQAVQFTIDEEGYATGIGYVGDSAVELKAKGEIVLRVTPEAEVSIQSAVSYKVAAGLPSNPAAENYWHIMTYPGQVEGGFEQTYSTSDQLIGGPCYAYGAAWVWVTADTCRYSLSYHLPATATRHETTWSGYAQQLGDDGLLAYYTNANNDIGTVNGFYTGGTVEINTEIPCGGQYYPVSFSITYGDWSSVGSSIIEPSVTVTNFELHESSFGNCQPVSWVVGGANFTRTGERTSTSNSTGYVLTKATPYRAAFSKDGSVLKASTSEVQNVRNINQTTIKDNSVAAAVAATDFYWIDRINSFYRGGWIHIDGFSLAWGPGSKLTCSFEQKERVGQFYTYHYGYTGETTIGSVEGFIGDLTILTGEYAGSFHRCPDPEQVRIDEKNWETLFLFESDPEYATSVVYRYVHDTTEAGAPITTGKIQLLGESEATLISKTYQQAELENINGDNGFMAVYSRYNMPFNETETGSSFITQNFSIDHYSLYGFADGRIYSLPESVLNLALVSGGWWMGDAGGQAPAGFVSKVIFKSSNDEEINAVNKARADSIQSYFDTNFAGKDLRFLGLSMYQQITEVN